jgi:hypothetical protein
MSRPALCRQMLDRKDLARLLAPAFLENPSLLKPELFFRDDAGVFKLLQFNEFGV